MALGWYGWRTGSNSAFPFGIPSPEFGISETIAPKVGSGQTTSISQNIANRNNSSTQAPSGSVLGASTGANYSSAIPASGPSTQFASNPTNQGGRYNELKAIADAGNLNPAQQTEWNQLNPQQGPSEADMFNQAYSGYMSMLDNQLNELGGYQTQQNDYIGQQANLQQERLGSQRDQGLQKLGGYETEAKQNKATTLRDIQSDLVNSLQAGQVYLGGIGAGSSSAVGRMSGALAKGANQRVTDVNNQFGKIQNDINMQRQGIDNIYNEQTNQLNQWKNEQVNNIANWVQQQRQSIMNQRGQVDMQKNMQILDAARNALAQVDSQASTFGQAIQQWVADKSTSLDQFMGQMQGLGQYNVPGYTYDPMSGNFQSGARNNIIRQYYSGMGGDEEKLY